MFDKTDLVNIELALKKTADAIEREFDGAEVHELICLRLKHTSLLSTLEKARKDVSIEEEFEKQRSIGGDWEEDFAHENGNYQNTCIRCGKNFFGHKRRVVCKKCR